MGDIYAARWENAKDVATKIQAFINAGGVVHDTWNDRVYKMVITEDKVIAVGDGYETTYFHNNNDWAEGYHTPIEEWNKRFWTWTYSKSLAPEFVLWGMRKKKEAK